MYGIGAVSEFICFSYNDRPAAAKGAAPNASCRTKCGEKF